MAHQNTGSPNAAQQNTVGPERGAEQGSPDPDRRTEPRSYVANEVGSSSLAPPAAGEVADEEDFGDDLGGAEVQQGQSRTNRVGAAPDGLHGPKTRAALRAAQRRNS